MKNLLGAAMICGLLAAPALAQGDAEEKAPAMEPPLQVLFVGNSYFYYGDSIHNHVKRMVEESMGEGADLNFRSITISGGSLYMHPYEHYLTPGAIGYEEPFDMVILQGNSAAALDEEGIEKFTDAVVAADGLIRDSGAQTALYMTHAYEEGHKKYAPDNIDKIEKLYTEVGAQIGATVIPVGLAFEKARAAYPDLPLWKSFDHSHPDSIGTYLAAATVFATLYGKSPEGLSYDYFGLIDPEVAKQMQEIAAETVAEFQEK